MKEDVCEWCWVLEVDLVAVLTTHYHSDHSGGNSQLAKALEGLEVVAGQLDAERTRSFWLELGGTAVREEAHGSRESHVGIFLRSLPSRGESIRRWGRVERVLPRAH